jgi:CRP-like cAMP-binding protein
MDDRAHETRQAALDRIIPFAFLDKTRRAWVASRLESRVCEPKQSVVTLTDRAAGCVFLVATGSVELVETDDASPEGIVVRQTIHAGQCFGERSALLGQALPKNARAGESGAWLLVLTGGDFLTLVDESVLFAQALAASLVQKQKVFEPFRRLHAKILEVTGRGSFLLSEVVPYYRALKPALHPRLDSRELDVDALKYAVMRLPPEVSTTSFYFLTDTLPALYADPDAKFKALPMGKARRRAMWQLMPGKILVLLRDGLSDATDLLTCLCLYAIEAKKLRRRIGTDKRLRQLAELVAQPDPTGEHRFLEDLPLSPDERAGLLRCWPVKTAERLREVLLHHEDVAFDVRRSVAEYGARASEAWVSQVREEAARLVDLDDPELDVHVISSNTHSVGNCLSSYLAGRADRIVAWGLENAMDVTGPPSPERPWGHRWARRADLVYVLVPAWLAKHPEEVAQREAEERRNGRVHMNQTAFTGIQVDLIDARALRDDATDPDVPVRVPRRPTLVVNVDYAFGEQADEILAALIFLFGRRIASVNVLGKAGALIGKRGDFLLPRATLLQTNDELYPLPNHDLSRRDLELLASGRSVHEGPLLTVAGTLLQDRPLLLLYKRIWRCMGLEMEGSYFARRVIAAIETGLLSPAVKTRFAYYVSDVPLEPSSTLVEALRPEEGVPPLYAITRAVLRKIFA